MIDELVGLLRALSGLGRRTKDAPQVIVEIGSQRGQGRARALVMLLDGVRQLLVREVVVLAGHDRWLLPDLAHDAFEVFELWITTPAAIALAPGAARSQPNRERLGEVFFRMLLRVPTGDVAHEVARERVRLE